VLLSFQTVANYIGATRTLEYVPETKIYWAGGRTDPPPDTPTCGFDNSLCPDNCKYDTEACMQILGLPGLLATECVCFSAARVRHPQYSAQLCRRASGHSVRLHLPVSELHLLRIFQIYARDRN
jgi:hypothetical protein